MDDNEPERRLFENCRLKARRAVNPIIDWADDEIWEYIKAEKLNPNPLYECGFKRVGCVGCPMAGKARNAEFAMFPKYKDLYIAAFDRMLTTRKREKGESNRVTNVWHTGRDVFHWWMKDGVLPGQIEIEDILDENSDSL